MKISLLTLASIDKADTVDFMNKTNLSYQQIEKYVGGQCSKFSLLRAKAYKAQEMGKIEKEEMIEILAFCNENTGKCQEIARNFDLFKNVGIPRNTYASYANRVNNLLRK